MREATMQTDTATEARIRLDVPHEEYHTKELGVVTTGAIKAVLKTPAHYRSWVDAPDHDTPAREFGRAVHCAVFEPMLFLDTYVMSPVFGDRRYRAEKARYAEWKATICDREILSAEDYGLVGAIGLALLQHPLVSRLLAGGVEAVAEATIEWRDEETGLICKCRPDWWSRPLSLMLDLKTCMSADDRRFGYSCRDFGYDLQSVHYMAGAEALGMPCDFLFAAVEKEPPHAVAVYQIDPDSLDDARTARRDAMRAIAHGVETGEWPGYPTDIQTLTLPRRKR
jgi:PDDEXK-like domain of unknown function (DUF3799)